MQIETLDWLLDHAASVYQSERATTEKIRDRVNFTVGLVITPLSGAAIFLASNFKGEINTALSGLLFVFPLAVAVCLLGYSVWIILHVAAKGHQYSHPPLPSQLSAYIDEFSDQESTLTDLKKNILKSYENAIDHNNAQNINRTNRLLHATKVAIYAIPFVALTASYHMVIVISAEEKPLKVSITGKINTLQEVSHGEQNQESRANISQYFITEACPCSAPPNPPSISGKQDGHRKLQGQNRKDPINSLRGCK